MRVCASWAVPVVLVVVGTTPSGAGAGPTPEPPGGLFQSGTPITAPPSFFKPRVPNTSAPDNFFHHPGVLFINFDGAQMQNCNGSDWPGNDCSSIMNDEVLPYSGDSGARAAVVQIMASDVEDFALTVVGERPIDNDEYDMVMVGNWSPPPDEGGFAGVAPTIDCWNQTKGETSFSLDYNVSTVAKIVGQEAAHVWGLEHVDSPNDVLYPTTAGAADPAFEDVCYQIVILDGGIQPTGAMCPEMHEINCPGQPDFQSSYQDMMMMFGPSSPDITPPTLEIVAPADGEAFASGASVEVVIEMYDDIAPPLFDVFANVDVDEMGALIGSGDYKGPSLTLPVNGLPDGEHLVRIDVHDQSGNVASDVVTFVIGESSAETGGTGGDTATDGSGEPGDETGNGNDPSSTGGDPSGPSGTGDTDVETETVAEVEDEPAGCGCRPTGRAGPAWLLVLVAAVRRRRVPRQR